MIRGTTPTHKFNIPFDTSDVAKVKVIYAQDDEILIVKGTDECVLEGNTITVTLSQQETFEFEYGKSLQIQLRILTNSGQSLVSVIETVGVSKCLDNEVME